MNFAARKSDVRNHLSRPVKRHNLSPDATNLSEKMVAVEEVNGDRLKTPISNVDSGQQPSGGVYAANTVTAQH